MADFVSVPVPADRVQEVYELLARAQSRPSVGHLATDPGYSEGWNQALLDRMFQESSSAMRRILKAIADRSASWVTTNEIAGAAGLTGRQVVASFGPFEKRIRGRYGMRHWPFETREFVDAGVFKYCMSAEPANRILTLMEEAERHEATTT
jgi:hypothetical protein